MDNLRYFYRKLIVMEEPLLFERSMEDVSTMVGHAKLLEGDLLPVSQVISFTNTLMGDNIKLLEVSSEVADSLQSGNVLIMRGEEGDNSVLCSHDKTFEIKVGELDYLDDIHHGAIFRKLKLPIHFF